MIPTDTKPMDIKILKPMVTLTIPNKIKLRFMIEPDTIKTCTKTSTL